MFAATYPERTTASVLFSPFVVGMADEDCPWAWTSEFWDLLRAAMENNWGTPDGSVEFCTPRHTASLAWISRDRQRAVHQRAHRQTHINHIFAKTNSWDRAQAIRYAHEHGLA